MTVLADTQAYIQYTGTGSRVFYEYGFEMLDDSVVYVLVDGQPTVVTLQDTGVVFDPAPALDAVILIYRITDITQLADFQSFEAFHGVKTEDALDKLILLKQEAVAFRAQMNLLANHKLDRVTIENDKGTDADIFYWNELEAGVFGGEVTQNMPNAGTVVEKPEDFAYFQWGDGGVDPNVPANYEYLVFLDDVEDSLRYLGVDFDTKEVVQFGTFLAPVPNVSSDGIFVFLSNNTTKNIDQFVWRGNCFSLVYSDDHAGSNGAASMTQIKNYPKVILVGTEAFGWGERSVGYRNQPPFSWADQTTQTSPNPWWNGCWDFRYGNKGVYEYGDALIVTPQNGEDIATFRSTGGALSLVDTQVAATRGTTTAWGVNRENGYVATEFAGNPYFDLYKVGDDLTISTIGRCSSPATGYNPDMMEFDGSTGYYSNATVNYSGTAFTAICRFKIPSFSGGGIKRIMQGSATGGSRLLCYASSNDHATTTQRDTISFIVQNTAGGIICFLLTDNSFLDDELHTFMFSFDGTVGTATLIIDGSDADDTGNPDRQAPITGTTAIGGTELFAVGAGVTGNDFTAGDLGFVGWRDAYLTNWQDFMEPGGWPKQLDEVTWTEWGAQPLFWNEDGEMTTNLGSAGNMTKNGTIIKVNVGIPQDNIFAVTVANNGIVLTLEDTGGAKDMVRSYTRVGTTLTFVDEFELNDTANLNSMFFISPRTDRIWLTTISAINGLFAFLVDDLGNITEEINIPNKAAYNAGGTGNRLYFVENSLNITTNGFTGIKSKLYECWEMNEVGSVTRIGAMGNYDLPVLVGTVTDRPGVIGNAAVFDGASALGTTEQPPFELQTTSNFSACFDAVIDVLPGVDGDQFFFIRGEDATGIQNVRFDFGCYVSAAGELSFYVTVGSTIYEAVSISTGAITPGQKYHIYIEYSIDNHEVSIRVNSGDTHTTAVVGDINANPGRRFRMGRKTGYNNLDSDKYYDGSIDQFYWFWDALTEAEQDWMYNSGNSRAFSEL